MAHRILFIGGPQDGKSATIRSERPPPVLHQAVNQGLPFSLNEPSPLYPPPQASYRLVLDDLGVPSRADDGAYRYKYTGQS